MIFLAKIKIKMFGLILSLVWLAIIGYALGKDPNLLELSHSTSRQARFFPFYTIGRFVNEVCSGANKMLGTCVIRGECKDGGGVSTGSCNSITTQAVCCVYQLSCGGSTNFNNTYFYNSGYPGTFNGGSKCTLAISPCNDDICQLRIDFLVFSLAPPNGDGECNTDFITIEGGSSRVPRICGENAGQHVYIDFNGGNDIEIAVLTTGSYNFNRQWQLQVSQIACSSPYRAPSGCLQYNLDSSGTIRSFNYATSANGLQNSIGVEGSRQLADIQYGICIRMGANRCSISYSQVSSDIYSFTMTGDVGAIDPALLGTSDVQSQDCREDFIIIPNPEQKGKTLPSDRFCGLGLVKTTSYTKPFVMFVVQDSDERMDMSNRGFALDYSQGACPVT